MSSLSCSLYILRSEVLLATYLCTYLCLLSWQLFLLMAELKNFLYCHQQGLLFFPVEIEKVIILAMRVITDFKRHSALGGMEACIFSWLIKIILRIKRRWWPELEMWYLMNDVSKNVLLLFSKVKFENGHTDLIDFCTTPLEFEVIIIQA